MDQLLIAVVAWALSNFFMKLSLFYLNGISAVSWQVLGIIVMMSFILGWEGFSIERNVRGASWAFASGLLTIFAAYIFWQALRSIKLSVAMPFVTLNYGLTALLGIAILREALMPIQLAGGALMLIGAVLLSMQK